MDIAGRVWHHSMIFGYYKEDFGGSVKQAAKFAARWYPDGPEKQLLLGGEFRASETPYDWALNSQENYRKSRAR